MAKYLYVTIGVLTLLLSGAGYFAYHQSVELGKAEDKIESLEATIIKVVNENEKNNERILTLQRTNSALEQEKAASAEKALKDISRVEEIAKRKSKLYEKLVNRDFNQTQNELRELTR